MVSCAFNEPCLHTLLRSGVQPLSTFVQPILSVPHPLLPTIFHLQVFDCAPHELGPDIRAELESMLQVSVEAVEAAVRWAYERRDAAFVAV